MPKKNPAAVSLGSLGGRKRSDAKARAARKNGKKGGRPKKDHSVSITGVDKLVKQLRRLPDEFKSEAERVFAGVARNIRASHYLAGTGAAPLKGPRRKVAGPSR